MPLASRGDPSPEERASMAWSLAGVSPVWHARLIEAFEKWPALAHGIQPECPSTLDTQHLDADFCLDICFGILGYVDLPEKKAGRKCCSAVFLFGSMDPL